MGRDGFFGYDAVQNALEGVSGDLTQTFLGDVVTWAIRLSVAFVILNFLRAYLNSMKPQIKDTGMPIDISSVIFTVIHVAFVAKSIEILGITDSVLTEFNNLFKVTWDGTTVDELFSRWCQEYEEAYDMYMKDQSNDIPILGEVVNSLNAIFDLIASAFYFVVLVIIKGLAWVVHGLSYPVFLIERGFLLMMMKVTAPFIFALGVFEKFRDLVIKWFKTYAAIFVSGVFFILTTWFCDTLFINLADNFWNDTVAGNSPTVFDIETGLMDRHLVQVCYYTMIVVAKIKLYVTSISLSNRLFS